MAKYVKTEDGYKSLTSLNDTKMDKENPTGTGSFSLNRKANTKIGNYSFSEGKNNTASGGYSHAEGYNTEASGNSSHAEGEGTTASGADSHAEGAYTTANGEASHAEGKGTKASTWASHAEGEGTKAYGFASHVQGRYNITDSTHTYAHIVGNGSSYAALSNAHTLDWDGNAWFAGDVYISSTSGTNKDDGSKKLATEEYVNEAIAGNVSSGIYVQATAPENPKDGDIWVDLSDETTYIYAEGETF